MNVARRRRCAAWHGNGTQTQRDETSDDDPLQTGFQILELVCNSNQINCDAAGAASDSEGRAHSRGGSMY